MTTIEHNHFYWVDEWVSDEWISNEHDPARRIELIRCLALSTDRWGPVGLEFLESQLWSDAFSKPNIENRIRP